MNQCMSERVTAKRSGEKAIVPLLQGGLASHPEEAVGAQAPGRGSSGVFTAWKEGQPGIGEERPILA